MSWYMNPNRRGFLGGALGTIAGLFGYRPTKAAVVPVTWHPRDWIPDELSQCDFKICRWTWMVHREIAEDNVSLVNAYTLEVLAARSDKRIDFDQLAWLRGRLLRPRTVSLGRGEIELKTNRYSFNPTTNLLELQIIGREVIRARF